MPRSKPRRYRGDFCRTFGRGMGTSEAFWIARDWLDKSKRGRVGWL